MNKYYVKERIGVDYIKRRLLHNSLQLIWWDAAFLLYLQTIANFKKQNTDKSLYFWPDILFTVCTLTIAHFVWIIKNINLLKTF